MTFNPALTTLELVWLAEIEPARRLESLGWTQGASPNTDVYYIAHPEGKPSRVRECLKSTGAIVLYDPDVADLATCQSTASSWYWDAANSRLYVHTSTAADPGGGLFLVCSYFWERIADRKIDLDGHPYMPLLDPSSIANVSLEAPPFSGGGISQSFGSVRILNHSHYWDKRLAAYVYEGKRIVIKFGKYGDAYADYVSLFNGYTGGTKWEDGSVTFDTEDPRRFQE
jgi:hypothetical protein